MAKGNNAPTSFSDETAKKLRMLGFNQCAEENQKFIWRCGDSIIEVNNSVVEYDSRIRIERKTSCDLRTPESFVVLECVIRLISLGYEPGCISLEKTWTLGHDGKGHLDICVSEKSGKVYMMIECKTWGSEYNAEKNKMVNNGGQLFSYFQQEVNARLLVLYASEISDSIKYRCDIVPINSEIKNKENKAEKFEAWDKSFKTRGILDRGCKPYNFESHSLRHENLIAIDEPDGGQIFNQFKEILRRRTISDSTNAYNKIFNMFICKIVDEKEKTGQAVLDFQIKEGDTQEQIIDRLIGLYEKGMRYYIKRGSRTASPVEAAKREAEATIKDRKAAAAICESISQMSRIGNSDFAFKDVYDAQSFDENMEIVKDIVNLLSPFKLLYSHKHQYLGEFFERLLATSIKQEAGQFFTPIPLARFICKSLPVSAIIEKKVETGSNYVLPYVIDYASGSGHFLTEIMDEIDRHVAKIKTEKTYAEWQNQVAQSNFTSKMQGMAWTSEYVYGIEKDYRLAKTTKVSSFLNGDGDANILLADGLLPFSAYPASGVLSNQCNKTDNEEFDIVVANPPYAVSGFKNAMKGGGEHFSLHQYARDGSKEIECLFMERTKQLLRPDGVAGIVLPRSFLESDEQLVSMARKQMLENFHIVSIVELGKEAFSATDIKTVVLFLKKKAQAKLTDDKVILINLNIENNKDEERRLLGYDFSNRRGKEGISTYNDGILFNPDEEQATDRLAYYIMAGFNHENAGFFEQVFDDNGTFRDSSTLVGRYMTYTSLSKIAPEITHLDPCSADLKFVFSLGKSSSQVTSFACEKIKPLGSLLLGDPLSGSRPRGGVARIESGTLSIGGGQIRKDGRLDFSKCPYVPVEFSKGLDAELLVKKKAQSTL